MAQRDLDAALQLLAQRAEYITEAGGAAIALQRDGRDGMMCRASAGANAPEVGALFSNDSGLSGESVRTRQPLRCHDAERDSRVNHEICRQLGIASVVVMPVVDDDQVLGVFELFSGKPNAFGDRDLAALQRLSELVVTAVKLARAAEASPDLLESAVSMAPAAEPAVTAPPSTTRAPAASAAVREQKKKLWSALDVVTKVTSQAPDQSHVPPMLRNLRKCEACGFPISPGRTLCVECEEKKWRRR
jgi:transcriptional regulator with GAF, ATPase, and Fis domain